MKDYLKGKTVLVTGGSGSIGSELVRHLLNYNVETIRVFSNDEDGLFNLKHELSSYSGLRYLIGDMRDKERLRKAFEGVSVIFHAAALKHVPFCEYNPFEAVMTNVIGTQNMIEAALESNVERVVTISTDKATNPTNVLGSTKLLAERLTSSANYYRGYRQTIFSSVRFGNVLASRGSVVPIFLEQIRNGGPLTVTNFDMTRFVMSINKAVDLVLKAAVKSIGGEIFILKMPALKIGDLAESMIELYAEKYGHDEKKIKIKTIGIRDGEKMHEELMTDHEAENSYETDDMYILIPQKIFSKTKDYEKTRGKYSKYAKTNDKMYQSDKVKLLNKKGIKSLLKKHLE